MKFKSREKTIKPVKLKSDYFRIEILFLVFQLFRVNSLKSDYFRIEILKKVENKDEIKPLKSDYFRIEIRILHGWVFRLSFVKIRLF